MAITYTQPLLERAEAYLAGGLNARREKDGLTEIAELVSAITGEPNGGCRQCQYLDYLAIVKNYTRAARRFLHPETVSESKYAIAPGLENETFVHEGLSEAITAENLTDQAAEFLISKGFKHAFVLKSGQEAAAKSENLTEVVSENPLVPEADLKKEKEAHAASNTRAAKALDAEQNAHKATKKALDAEKKVTAALLKERDELHRQVADLTAKLTQPELPAPEPATPAVDPATVS